MRHQCRGLIAEGPADMACLPPVKDPWGTGGETIMWRLSLLSPPLNNYEWVLW
jgi:hypothetical protein